MAQISKINQKTDEEFSLIVKESYSIAEIENKLGYNAYSGCVATKIKERIELLKLDISHFNSYRRTTKAEDIFILNSKAAQATVRRNYLKNNYSPYICSICGQKPEWKGKPLTLILDHINGNNKDNRIENLHWVCPNCNQQLETTGSKNIAYKENTDILKSRQELKDLIRIKSISEMAKILNIGETTVRNKLIKVGLPTNRKIILTYTDEEWENF